MITEFYTITNSKPSKELMLMLKATTKNLKCKSIDINNENQSLRNKHLIIGADLDELGYCFEILQLIKRIYQEDTNGFMGSSAILIINSPTELYTKSFSQDIILRMNSMGCRFPGHPLIENIEGSKNFRTWQLHLNMELFDIALQLSEKHGDRYLDYVKNLHESSKDKKKLLALHASSRSTSNTLAFWHMIKDELDASNFDIEEFNVENGTIIDCLGCEFTTCMHYSKKNSCFYGGVITKELLPAIEASDIIVWICPNYNDAISAKLMAVINRLTVLYRRRIPYDKEVFAVVVSGNSGSDSIGKQLIGALNINKGFELPPYFMVSTIANNPGDINSVDDIADMSKAFADKIK